MKLQVKNTINKTPALLFDMAIRRLVRSFGVYHPVTFKGQRIAPGERGCEDRWRLISTQIQQLQARTVLDLGCAEGYFVRQAAKEHGCVALGVDGDVRRLMIAQTAATQDQDDRAGFMFAQITPDLVDHLPTFDLVMYQSVMHHVMYEHGVDYSRDMLQRIRARTGKAMVFDMGQSNEKNSPWSRLLPDMGSDPHAWIKEFLESAGFSEVRKIGETDAYRETVRRAVFLALR